MPVELYDHQIKALDKLRNGSILCGGTGSGKSLTAIAYYYLQNGGDIRYLRGGNHVKMKDPQDLYIITTAHKRDTCEWEAELCHFLMSKHDDANLYSNKIIIDSWNNIRKYSDVRGAFFIFDEQRVVGSGTWADIFVDISKSNDWILLSATPGDDWMDYVSVFLANKFFKTRKEFEYDHVVFSPFVKYKKVYRYINVRKLIRLRDRILVDMEFDRKTKAHHEYIYCSYDVGDYTAVKDDRWNIFDNVPIENAASMCYLLRKVVNSDESRQVALLECLEKHPKAIIFYNFDYELKILENLYYGEGVEVAQWNGHKHQPVPTGPRWVYLVQYTAGCEGWNCITTDTIIFYSQNYSYKVLAQAIGRIDRLNTPYSNLYYYHLKSRSGIDLAISKALGKKKKFNEGKFVKW